MEDAKVIVALTDRLTAVVSELAGCSVADLAEPDASSVHTALRKAQDALGLVAARVLGRIAADGRWANTAKGRASRDLEGWLAQESGGSRAGARRQARLARAVVEEAVPGLAEAIGFGQVTLEHADVLTRLGPTTEARRAALRSADPRINAAFLLGKASGLGCEEFTNEVKRWAATVDPTADEQGHRDASAKVSCTITPRDDTVAMTAVITPVDGAAFRAALTAVAGVPSIDDARSHAQRMGAALGDMARLILDHGLAATSTGGFRPHLSVTVSLDSMRAQIDALYARDSADGVLPGQPVIPAGWDAAVLADGTPIPANVLARLACDAEVTRVVFGPESQVLDVGRAERLYTGAMRRAVVARDRHCAYPGCDRPPSMGEVHHVQHWAAHGGSTSVDNGILLCAWHHDVVHSTYMTIRRNHARARWEFHRRDGTPIPHPEDHPGRPPSAGPSRQSPGRDGPPPLFEVT